MNFGKNSRTGPIFNDHFTASTFDVTAAQPVKNPERSPWPLVDTVTLKPVRTKNSVKYSISTRNMKTFCGGCYCVTSIDDIAEGGLT